MPTVECTRAVGATPQRLWDVVADPARLPDWRPEVRRVEDASRAAWTTVRVTPGGKSIRADYTLLDSEHPLRLVWRHEVDASPFERVLAESVTELALEPDGADTRVRLTTRLRLRGLSRLGALHIARATRRQLDGALRGLELLFRGWER